MSQLDQLNNLKVINITKPPAAVPPKAPKPAKPDQVTLLAKKLNGSRDMNKTHAFEFWVAYQHDINNFNKFSGYNPVLHRSILSKWNNFYGETEPNFTNLTVAETAYYSDFSSFLGINLKKTFGSIGHAFGWVGNEVGHAGKWVGNEASHAAGFVAHSAVDIAHDVRNVAVGAAHDVRNVTVEGAHGLGHAVKFERNLETRLHKFVVKETSQVGHAVAPYWKIIATAAICTVLIMTGVGIPVALAIGSALLTGLDAIKAPVPPLEMGAGSGGGEAGPTGDGSGFPSSGGDPSNGVSEADQQALAAQQQAAQQAQADYAAAQAKHIKKVAIIVAISIVGVIVAYLIYRHKKKK